MGLYSSMRTSASGMNAQSNRISSVADNIANSNTTGYKRSAIEFSTLVLAQGGSDYQSGSVNSNTQYFIAQQGAILPTSRWSNAAVEGDGFFVVQNPGGQTFFTRNGSFVPTEGTGFLENAAGMRLMGYPIANGIIPPVVLNGTAGLEQIQLSALALQPEPTTSGNFKANFPTSINGAPTPISVAANLPSANLAGAAASLPAYSLTVYDNVGNEVKLDIVVTRTAVAGGPAGTQYQWEVAVFNSANRGASADFLPYTAGPITSDEFYFDNQGQLIVTAGPPAGPSSLTFTVPNGQPMTLDMSAISGNAAQYAPEGGANGNAPSEVTGYEISDDGVLAAIYKNGARVDTFKIPLAKVPAPDKMLVGSGNTFLTSQDSGDFQMGFANEGGRGSFVGGALEQSNADLANELTIMIESQRNYTANSKVFQTSAELMDVLVNLQR
jgi:flagellar hook protein FlgE